MEKDTTEVLENLPIPDFKSSDSIEELMNKYIQYLKDVEKARGLSEDKINVKYVHGQCREFVDGAIDFLKLMGKKYGQYKDYRATCEGHKDIESGTHWLLEVFDEKTGDSIFYDIYGKHSLEEVHDIEEHFYKDNYSFLRETKNQMTEYELDEGITADITNHLYPEERQTDHTEQINDLKTQMEWFYKGQTLLGVEDLDKECTRLGLDFNDEMQQANERAKFKTELDEYEKLPEDEKNARWDEMTDKAGSLGLILKDELYFSHARNQLREEMSKFHQGTSEMSIQEIDDECKALGLNFNYEMESAKDIKNIGIGVKDCMKNIAVHQTASVVNKGSNEIKSNYNELENPKEKNDDNRSFDD